MYIFLFAWKSAYADKQSRVEKYKSPLLCQREGRGYKARINQNGVKFFLKTSWNQRGTLSSRLQYWSCSFLPYNIANNPDLVAAVEAEV